LRENLAADVFFLSASIDRADDEPLIPRGLPRRLRNFMLRPRAALVVGKAGW